MLVSRTQRALSHALDPAARTRRWGGVDDLLQVLGLDVLADDRVDDRGGQLLRGRRLALLPLAILVPDRSPRASAVRPCFACMAARPRASCGESVRILLRRGACCTIGGSLFLRFRRQQG